MTHEPRREDKRITDRCPSCGNQTLFIGKSGWLTCSWIKCKNPCVGEANQQAMQALEAQVKELEEDRSRQMTLYVETMKQDLKRIEEETQRADRLQAEVERLKDEKQRRLGYQSIVYAILAELDKPGGGHLVCGDGLNPDPSAAIAAIKQLKSRQFPEGYDATDLDEAEKSIDLFEPHHAGQQAVIDALVGALRMIAERAHSVAANGGWGCVRCAFEARQHEAQANAALAAAKAKEVRT